MTPSTEQYFSNLGINVEFNSLGKNNTLIQAYIANTQSIVNAVEFNVSENVKLACYSQFYTLSDRPKLTGFENFKIADRAFRIDISPDISGAQVRHAIILEKQPDANDYKSTLISSFSEYTKPILLYLSGGLDSELIANALLDAGKQFTPVIFKWTDGTSTQNDAEFQYALDFCSSHSITPIIKTVDIPSLWASSEFRQLAIDTQLISTQLVTHCYIVKVMHGEMPNMQHLFGGEVRYRTNYLRDDNSLANIILLTKVSPSYDGDVYDALITPSNSAGFYSLSYSAGGTWSVTHSASGSFSGGATSGTWTNTPASSYQYRVVAISNVNLSNNFTPSMASVPTAWASVGGQICRTFTNAGGLSASTATFHIEVRSVANPGVVMSSSITLATDNT
jgi:hypothetical protein